MPVIPTHYNRPLPTIDLLAFGKPWEAVVKTQIFAVPAGNSQQLWPGHCYGEHSIISESALGHEPRKVLRLATALDRS